MSAEIANWLHVNIVNNPQVLKSLIALIILIVASFLFSEKPTEKNLFRSRRVWGALLFVFAIFLFLHANIADLADVFIVWATIVLAGTAVFSFEESRRLRKQYTEREERDRKERLLDEIIEWASGCMSCAFEINRPSIGEAKSIERYINRLQIELEDKLKFFKTKTGYIKGIATPSLFGQSLSKAVNISIECLDLTINLIEKDKPSPKEEEDEKKQAKEELDKFIKREGGGLYKCMNKVLEEATKIKTRDIG